MGYKILNDDLTYANINSENPKVCFLHGWGTSGKDFNKIETHFDFITIDIPGFGKSVPFTKSFSQVILMPAVRLEYAQCYIETWTKAFLLKKVLTT